MANKIKITPRDWKEAENLCSGKGDAKGLANPYLAKKGMKGKTCESNSDPMNKTLGIKNPQFQCEWTRDPMQFVTKPTPAYIKTGVGRLVQGKKCAPVVKGARASVDLFGCPKSCNV